MNPSQLKQRIKTLKAVLAVTANRLERVAPKSKMGGIPRSGETQWVLSWAREVLEMDP